MPNAEHEGRARRIGRIVLALVYGTAGLVHLVKPGPFVAITPPWVPHPDVAVHLTGIAELLGAAGLMQSASPRLRHIAGWGLALYALCVWPANYHHMQLDLARADQGLGLSYHIPRLLAQPLIIWWALWSSGAIQRRPRQVPTSTP